MEAGGRQSAAPGSIQRRLRADGAAHACRNGRWCALADEPTQMSGIARMVEGIRLEEVLHHGPIAGPAGNAHDPRFLSWRGGKKCIEELASVATASAAEFETG